MPTSFVPIVLWGLTIILVLAFLFIQLRHRLRSTKGIDSFDALQARIGRKPFTLVQLFAPL